MFSGRSKANPPVSAPAGAALRLQFPRLRIRIAFLKFYKPLPGKVRGILPQSQLKVGPRLAAVQHIVPNAVLNIWMSRFPLGCAQYQS